MSYETKPATTNPNFEQIRNSRDETLFFVTRRDDGVTIWREVEVAPCLAVAWDLPPEQSREDLVAIRSASYEVRSYARLRLTGRTSQQIPGAPSAYGIRARATWVEREGVEAEFRLDESAGWLVVGERSFDRDEVAEFLAAAISAGQND